MVNESQRKGGQGLNPACGGCQDPQNFHYAWEARKYHGV